MRLLCPTDPDTCLPIRIGPRDDGRGARLGGRGPFGVAASPGCVYFATVPIYDEPVRESSIFLCADLETMLRLSDRVGRGGPIEVVVHEESVRGDDLGHASSLSEHSLIFAAPKKDSFVDAEGRREVESGHKMGGRPYLVRETRELRGELTETERRGYLHILQIDFPGNGGDELVSGDWPFADGVFHLFGRPPFASSDWRWLWQH